jgi:hypothetical protein
MSKEAMKLALEALENPWKAGPDGVADAITAIKEALAQPKQEPLAMEFKTDAEKIAYAFGWFKALELNRAQRTWVGLTDHEINDLVHSHDDFDGLWEFADAVEAKLKEKNT